MSILRISGTMDIFEVWRCLLIIFIGGPQLNLAIFIFFVFFLCVCFFLFFFFWGGGSDFYRQHF